jgi:hypothetical protein
MVIDKDKIDEVVLALMQTTIHDVCYAWKGFDFDTMDRLFEKGYICDPKNKRKSVILTDEGLTKSKELFDIYFRKKDV